MPAPMPDPSRNGVTLPEGAAFASWDLIVVPDRRKREADIRWRATYDADPVVIWERTVSGNFAVFRLSGPASARAWVRTIVHGARLRGETEVPAVIVLWEHDSPPHYAPERVELMKALTAHAEQNG